MSAPKEISLLSEFTNKQVLNRKNEPNSLMQFIQRILPSLCIENTDIQKSELHRQNIVQYRSHFDVFLRLDDGRFLIIEIPKECLYLNKDLSIHHSYQPIKDQEKRGVWNYEQYPVYIISILNTQSSENDIALIYCNRLIS